MIQIINFIAFFISFISYKKGLLSTSVFLPYACSLCSSVWIGSLLFTIEKRCAFFPFNHPFVVSTNALWFSRLHTRRTLLFLLLLPSLYCCCFISFQNYSKMDFCCWLLVVVLFGEPEKSVRDLNVYVYILFGVVCFLKG